MLTQKTTDLPQKKFKEIIEKNIQESKDFFFVQVGACDGVMNDPIYDLVIKYRLKGILIEPIKYLFTKLKQNYEQAGGLKFDNVAISNTREEKDLYYVDESFSQNRQVVELMKRGTPNWFIGYGSFFKEKLLRGMYKSLVRDFEKYIVKEKVRCVTFGDVVDKYKVNKIDLLLIDAEGYDFEIIKTLPFETVKPKMIWFEFVYLKDNDKESCLSFLRKNGYGKILFEGEDALAFL